MSKKTSVWCLSLLSLTAFFTPLLSQQQSVFEIAGISVGNGEKRSFALEVPRGLDEGTNIPITVVHGSDTGPVLLIVAGIHGYEYPPISALHSVQRELDPDQLAGTVILVHIANLPSFLARTIHINPIDGKNLNRVFPGDPNGTQSERIAHIITSLLVDRADYLVDMHGGDGNEALRPYVYWPVSGDSAFDQETRSMALAFGIDHIVVDPVATDGSPSRYTDHTAILRGIHAITTETGQLGNNETVWIDMATDGIWNLLRHLEMVPGQATIVEEVVWLENYFVIPSPSTGIFEATVRDGYLVSEGGLIGRLLDFFGNPTGEVRAPFSGVVNYVIGTPPINQGEPIAMLSRIR
ncbi:MAG: M14 family metallopeptidase [Myxococcota bacterium]|nr:M14 family metallopeptidase [Myxococcota bacterium]